MQFKVFGVSENRNSFGLREMRLMNHDGHFYTACANDNNVEEFGAVVDVPVDYNGRPHFEAMQFEIPERHDPDAPADVIASVWAL